MKPHQKSDFYTERLRKNYKYPHETAMNSDLFQCGRCETSEDGY